MWDFLRLGCLTLVLALGWGAASAQPLALKADHPQRYVVQRGDTLWDIAARFLQEPWRWPEIWKVNPQIRNPHLIHPGDVVVLTYEDGQPRLRLERRDDTPRVVRLQPRVRQVPLAVEQVRLPVRAMAPFFSREGILDAGDLSRAGRVVGSDDDRIVLGPGDRIYVADLLPGAREYVVFRPGKVFRDPEDPGRILGQEMRYLGLARLEQAGTPATLRLVEAVREVLPGDRLLPAEAEPMAEDLTPRLPDRPLQGRILEVLDGVSRIGQYQVVVLDVGERDGAEPGVVLSVYQRPGVLAVGDGATVPEQRVGTVLVFRSFERLSYALVTEALRELRVQDRIAAHP